MRAIVILVSVAIGAVCACAKSQPAKVAAEAAYTEQLLDCVDKSETYVESKACRAQVNARWGLLQDGGK